ncbi:calcium-dependent phosphotriesterase [Aaosphaeria arxii CBS 175.79]|uniref:Calcium-dependent phosphotriesterase n=1 Tax=Aaosphaeria arxii CBS 175.79 TaxID=1450172 RepID=A0A6A5XGM5_9PLEO|nr:calcium-dependent phosphotriesterase [Aaosphaeria arxii CBS 175.79]KAF2011514.1 calcium-dependent phosphotriesterase [Aaosphaeria arxii CBS 175.79]
MRSYAVSSLLLAHHCLALSQYLSSLPTEFQSSHAKWAWVSYESPAVAVIPGSFNRTALQAPHEGDASDPIVREAFSQLNETDFVAYDQRFFHLIGPDATIDHVQELAYQTHEAPCFDQATGNLFFAEWGPPGGDNGTHDWQYLLNTRNNSLQKIKTDPPTYNAHGCVIYDSQMYVVTDGYEDVETGQLVRIDPNTWRHETILNNYHGQPFLGFNDLDIDSDGNFWLTDSKSAFGRDLIEFSNPTNPTIYFVNSTTMRPRPVHITTGNTNGIAVSRSQADPSVHTVYLPDTGFSEFKPVSRKNPLGDRALFAYDAAEGGVLKNARFLNNPIAWFYDGIRASKNGYLFAGAGDGVDVIDPVDGLTLGTIRVGGGENVAVSVAFGKNELWIVGRGGVWHVNGVKEELARDW